MRADEFLSMLLSYGHAHRPLDPDLRLEVLREAQGNVEWVWFGNVGCVRLGHRITPFPTAALGRRFCCLALPDFSLSLAEHMRNSLQRELHTYACKFAMRSAYLCRLRAGAVGANAS
jgi:hypothetical protein